MVIQCFLILGGDGSLKQNEGKLEYYVPENRFDWQALAEKIVKLPDEQKKDAKKIFDLKIALKEHEYRQAFIGDYGSYNLNDLDGKPPYVNSKNAVDAEQVLTNLDAEYQAKYNDNVFSGNQISQIKKLTSFDTTEEKQKSSLNESLAEIRANKYKLKFEQKSSTNNVKDNNNFNMKLPSRRNSFKR